MVDSSHRYIPARAGQLACSSVADAPGRVHPRSRGAIAGLQMIIKLISGTSPCVRGNLSGDRADFRVRRYIPVCTGQTVCEAAGPALCKVHPRVYGANTKNVLILLGFVFYVVRFLVSIVLVLCCSAVLTCTVKGCPAVPPFITYYSRQKQAMCHKWLETATF